MYALAQLRKEGHNVPVFKDSFTIFFQVSYEISDTLYLMNELCGIL